VNNPQMWQAVAAVIAAFAALLGGLYAIVTRPLENHLNGMQNSIQGQLHGLQSQLNDITQRLARIEAKLDDHAQRIVRLEERTSPLLPR